MGASGRVGYAVVGLGQFAEHAVLPGFRNSRKAQLVALVSGAGTGSGSTRVIPAQVRASGASAALHLSDGHAVLHVNGMPQAAPSSVYEVWVQRGGAPQPTDALFTVSRSGQADVDVPGAIAGVRRVLVTSEPLGGTSVPTTRPVIIASLD